MTNVTLGTCERPCHVPERHCLPVHQHRRRKISASHLSQPPPERLGRQRLSRLGVLYRRRQKLLLQHRRPRYFKHHHRTAHPVRLKPRVPHRTRHARYKRFEPLVVLGKVRQPRRSPSASPQSSPLPAARRPCLCISLPTARLSPAPNSLRALPPVALLTIFVNASLLPMRFSSADRGAHARRGDFKLHPARVRRHLHGRRPLDRHSVGYKSRTRCRIAG